VLQEFLDQYALQHPFTAFPTRDVEGRVDGLIALSQLKQVPGEQRNGVRVRDVMWTLDQVPTARAGEPLTALLERMGGSAASRALVFDGDRLVGIVSPNDVSRAMQMAALRHPTSGALRPSF
jgi:CBS domain-containing protein